MTGRDVAAEIAALAREVAPALDAAAAARLEHAIRARWGGERVPILERAPVTLEQIDQRLRARMPVTEIAEDVGLSRATIYRMLRPSEGKKSHAPRT